MRSAEDNSLNSDALAVGAQQHFFVFFNCLKAERINGTKGYTDSLDTRIEMSALCIFFLSGRNNLTRRVPRSPPETIRSRVGQSETRRLS